MVIGALAALYLRYKVNGFYHILGLIPMQKLKWRDCSLFRFYLESADDKEKEKAVMKRNFSTLTKPFLQFITP